MKLAPLLSSVFILVIVAMAGYAVYFANPGKSVGVGFYFNCSAPDASSHFTCLNGLPAWLVYLVLGWTAIGVAGLAALYAWLRNLKSNEVEAEDHVSGLGT